MHFFKFIIMVVCFFSFTFISCKSEKNSASHSDPGTIKVIENIDPKSKAQDDHHNDDDQDLKYKDLIISFKNLMGSKDLSVKSDTTYGDAIELFLKLSKSSDGFENHGYFINDIDSITNENTHKILGRDISLNEKITENTKIHHMIYSLKGIYSFDIHRPLKAYSNNEQWSPCTNFYGDEPINKEKVGVVERSYGNNLNNHPRNMIILSFGKRSIDRIAYNKNYLLNDINYSIRSNQLPKDPVFNKPISESAILKLIASNGNFEIIQADQELENDDEFID